MKLADWRKSRGLTQDALGDIVGTTGNAIARYEAKRRRPTDAMLRKFFVLSEGLVDPNSFFPLEEWKAERIRQDARAELARKAA